jgi:hypothetical protein
MGHGGNVIHRVKINRRLSSPDAFETSSFEDLVQNLICVRCNRDRVAVNVTSGASRLKWHGAVRSRNQLRRLLCAQAR